MENKALNESMMKIVEGVTHFQNVIYKEKQALFTTLAKGQQPKILFITCSDSRIDSALITQTEPGEMFLITNAGNIVPPLGAAYGGTGASIEYAVAVLGVEHIIVCGHSACGAMGALLNLDAVENLPAVKHWLSFADATRAIMEAEGQGMSDEEKHNYCIKMNVPVQLGHLRTLPSVAAKLVQKKIQLHGWVYNIATGEIDVYDQENDQFISFEKAYAVKDKALV